MQLVQAVVELPPVGEYYAAMLSRATRGLVLLVAFIALQASVLGSAAACALGGHHPMASGTAFERMPDMAGTPSDDPASFGAPSSGLAGSPSSVAAAETSEGDAHCEHDTPAARCAAMPMCTAFIGTPSAPANEPGAPVTRVASAITIAPELEALPPEFPPPRA